MIFQSAIAGFEQFSRIVIPDTCYIIVITLQIIFNNIVMNVQYLCTADVAAFNGCLRRVDARFKFVAVVRPQFFPGAGEPQRWPFLGATPRRAAPSGQRPYKRYNLFITAGTGGFDFI